MERRIGSSSQPRPTWLKAFLLILFGQTVSMIGSRMIRFALSVWIFEQTGSVTQFSLMLLFMSLPNLLVSPVLGVYIDRLPRRRVLIACDSLEALGSILLGVLVITRRLTIPWVYPIVFFSALFDALRVPAFGAAITTLAPKDRLARANALLASAEASARVIAPFLAGMLFESLHLFGLAVVDVLSFTASIGALWAIRFKEAHTPATDAGASIFAEARQGWSYTKSRVGLFRLMLFHAAMNFVLGIFTALFSPMVLTFGTARDLGTIMSIGSIGMLIGALSMSAVTEPERKVPGILGFTALLAVGMALSGVKESVPWCSAFVFVFLFCQPVISSLIQTIFQRKTEGRVQGRVFSIARMTARSMEPLAYLTASVLPPVAMRYVERPYGAIFWGLGGAMLGVVALAARSRPLRTIDALPDLCDA